MDLLLISLGGAAGAVLRFGVGIIIRSRAFPWATLLVNALGSFILGIVLFSGVEDGMVLLMGVGFCGAFTTFSSFSFQTVELWETGAPRKAVINAVANLGISLLGFSVAWGIFAIGIR